MVGVMKRVRKGENTGQESAEAWGKPLAPISIVTMTASHNPSKKLWVTPHPH